MASGAHSAASPPRSRASRRAARRKRSVTARSPASMASRAMAPVATPCCAASVSRRARSDTGMLTVRLLASGSAPSGPRRLRGLDRSIVVLTQYTIVTSIARINQALNRSSLVRNSTFHRLTVSVRRWTRQEHRDSRDCVCRGGRRGPGRPVRRRVWLAGGARSGGAGAARRRDRVASRAARNANFPVIIASAGNLRERLLQLPKETPRRVRRSGGGRSRPLDVPRRFRARIRPVPELGDTLLVDGRPAVVVSLLPCRRRHEATARYAYDLPCSRCGAPRGYSVLIQRWWCNGCRVAYGRDALAEAGARMADRLQPAAGVSTIAGPCSGS